MITIYKGDDTGGTFGKRVTVTVTTDLPMEQADVVFNFAGCEKVFHGFASGSTFELVFSHRETANFPVGTNKASIYLRDASGKIRHLKNGIPFKVTTNLDECYAEENTVALKVQYAVAWGRLTDVPNYVLTVNNTKPDSDGNLKLNPIALKGVDMTGIEDWTESTTNKERRLSFNKLLAALRTAVACWIVAVLGIYCAFGADSVGVTTDGELDENSQVVTNVVIDHEGAITDKVTEKFVTKLIAPELNAKEDAEVIVCNWTTNIFEQTGLGWIGCEINVAYTNGWIKSIEAITSSGVGQWKSGVPFVVHSLTNSMDNIMRGVPFTEYCRNQYVNENGTTVLNIADIQCWYDFDKVKLLDGSLLVDSIPEYDGYYGRSFNWKNYKGSGIAYMVSLANDRIWNYRIYFPAYFEYRQPFAIRVKEANDAMNYPNYYACRSNAVDVIGTYMNYGVIPSAQSVTNTINGVVTKEYVENLGIDAGLDAGQVGTISTNTFNTLIKEADIHLSQTQITNAVQGCLNRIYDEGYKVTWQAVMIDGNLYYWAVTNSNTTVVK